MVRKKKTLINGSLQTIMETMIPWQFSTNWKRSMTIVISTASSLLRLTISRHPGSSALMTYRQLSILKSKSQVFMTVKDWLIDCIHINERDLTIWIVIPGDLENEDEILEWLLSQLEKDEIEDVTDEMLDRLVKDGKTIAVLFCKYDLRW